MARLSQGEWKVMELLWESPQTLMELSRALAENPGWSKSTVTTMLRRMEDKGIVAYTQEGRTKRFRPAVERAEIVEQETDSLLERAYRGSVGLLVNTLAERKRLSEREIEELYEILRRAEEDREEKQP